MNRRIEEIERLTRLRDAGALSPAEFEAEKARVLGDIDWLPVAPWFPRRYIRIALTAVAVCSLAGLAAGMIVYRSLGKPTAAVPGALSASPAPFPGEPASPVASPSAGAPAAPCDPATKRTYARKSELPAGVLNGFGGDLAEAGSAFQVTDAGPVSDLPGRRFVSAQQDRCVIMLRYEQGGVAHTFETAELRYAGGHWQKAASHQP